MSAARIVSYAPRSSLMLHLPPSAVLAAAALLLLFISADGPDFRRYRDWMRAFETGDILRLSNEVGSPLPLPLSQWAHGPGMVFSLSLLALRETTDPNNAALVTGWMAGLVFWWAFLRLISWACGGKPVQVLLGAGLAFTGTHAGFYSFTHASESLAYAFAALVFLEFVTPARSKLVSAFVVASATALLITTRTYLVVYALPVWLLTAYRAIEIETNESAGRWHRFLALVAIVVIPLIGIAQVSIVNRWMTGHLARSPYVYGGDGFSSFVWWSPEIIAVSVHPWHGLFVYHPLYLFGLVAAAVCLRRATSGQECVLWAGGGGLFAVLVNLYVQAGWFAWWMGTGTFGMRGMATAALVAVPAILRLLASDMTSQRARRLWIAAVTVCASWSFLLLLQGQTQFFTYRDLLWAQAGAILRLGGSDMLVSWGLGLLVAIATYRGAVANEARQWSLEAFSTVTLGTLSIGFLIHTARSRSVTGQLSLMRDGMTMLVVILSLVLLGEALRGTREWRSTSPRDISGRLVRGGLLATMVLSTILFVQFAFRTEARLISGDFANLRYSYYQDFHVEEALALHREYQWVPGFDAKKAAFENFLKANGLLPRRP